MNRTVSTVLALGLVLAMAPVANAAPLLTVKAFNIIGGGGSNDNDLNNVTETLTIWDAIDTGATTGTTVIGPKTYNIQNNHTGTAAVVDYAGGGGDFTVNTPYSAIGAGLGGDDFSVRALATLTFNDAGTYRIRAGSDDGRYLRLAGVTFDAFGGQGGESQPVPDTVIFNGTTGHNRSWGEFTVGAGASATLDAHFFERGGGDSFEVSIEKVGTGGYQLLANGVYNIGVDNAYVLPARLVPPPPPPPTMLSYWDFDSKTGTTIADQVAGSTHDGTLINDADITSGDQGYGGSGEALDPDALNTSAKGYMLAADSPAYDSFNGPFTWHARVKTTGGNAVGILTHSPLEGTNWNPGAKMLFLEGNRVEFDTGWVANPNTNWQLTDDQWHQLVVTFDPTTDAFKIFVDGVARFDGTHNADQHGTNANQFFHVGWGSQNFQNGEFPGLIDDVALFDQPLVGADLDQIFQQGPQAWLDPNVIPEPMTMLAVGLGITSLGGYIRKRRRA